jgi:SAM-dependent methyltransferase/uncharacterized protein YbaR (Trm112 family)
VLTSREKCLEILCCPRHGGRLVRTSGGLVCECAGSDQATSYPFADGMPILIDFEQSIFDREETIANAAKSPVERPQYRGPLRVVKRMLSPRKTSTRSNVSILLSHLADQRAPRVLVVGGGSVGQGMEPLYENPDVEIFAFDVYRSRNIHFIGDAHHMPLPDAFFDAVVVQAVLEHVLNPQDVVAEIWRVLKDGGLVYAETPFMQQVHEGPYDFTRFTESGHRYLFRRFEMVRSGASGGPGLQFMWSVDYLARSLFRSRTAGKLAKLAFFWVRYLDKIIPAEYAVDGASGVFFFGRKAQASVPPSSMVAYYSGAQR